MTATRLAADPVDIIVPVYNAPDDVRRCVESVLAHTDHVYRLILIDNASTDPGVAALLAEVAARRLAHVLLLHNERNLGFTRTANRGLAHSGADVVLLNSDAIVTSGWLDALLRCAASDPRIATVTPFSNNAEICSFPVFCADNPWSASDDAERVRAALAKAAVPTHPDLPTGVGFCLYIRREVLDEIGAFDAVFGAGYGEENDFCLRAARAGYRNVLADDAFVVHAGGRSFVGQKQTLGARNLAIIAQRHPHYGEMVRTYIEADPLRPLREAAAAQLAAATRPGRGVLHVIHHHGGGTETHVRSLIDWSRDRWRHYLLIAVGDSWKVEEHRNDGTVVHFDFSRQPDEPWAMLLSGLCATLDIALLHLHNISGSRDGLLTALADFTLPYIYTAHDLNFACPTITFLAADEMYCGAETDPAICRRCLAAQPPFAGIDIVGWRERHRPLLARAAAVIAPSRWAADTMARYFPETPASVIAHGTDAHSNGRRSGLRLAAVLPDDAVPTVVAIGAIGPDKGARRIERLVEIARQRHARVRFVVIGYTDVERGPWQSEDAALTVHGRYDPADLPDLLAHYRARLILYPSAGPETFSYTLSEVWAASMPVLVPPIGALVERVAGTGAGFVMSDREWRDEAAMFDRLLALLETTNASQLATAATLAAQRPQSGIAEMAGATFALYDRALAGACARPERPLAPERVRNALGYRPWTPPVIDEPVVVVTEVVQPPKPAQSALGRFARAALAIRHTSFGRMLYRLTPRFVLEALKARLSA